LHTFKWNDGVGNRLDVLRPVPIGSRCYVRFLRSVDDRPRGSHGRSLAGAHETRGDRRLFLSHECKQRAISNLSNALEKGNAP
jgi:hypothetical protein